MSHPAHGSRRVPLVLFLLLITACGGQQAPGAVEPEPRASTSTPPEPSEVSAGEPSASEPSASDPLEDRTIASLRLGGGPDMPTEAFGSLWVIAVDGPLMNDGTEPAVHRIDPETNEVVASISLPGRLCQGIGASPEAIWACGPDGLVRIDPNENAIVATVDLPAALVVSRIAYGAGSVWAFATSGVAADTVVRVDPATNAVTATIPLEHAAGTMAFGFDALWVTSPTDDLLLRIDPATDVVEEWATGIEGASWVGIGDDAVWVSLLGEEGRTAEEGEPTVARIDPATGDVVASIATGGSVEISGGLAPTADGIWVRAPYPFLVRIDPATNEVVDLLDEPPGGGDVTFAFDSLWVTTERGELIRMEPGV